ncbi:hypothetical protein [Pseudomonas sp. TMP9]|uniref:hypothetical protein n=1 Tax=Pseudomonas sp. TMP9 TaxID=3133144 RepID=UPI0030D2304B
MQCFTRLISAWRALLALSLLAGLLWLASNPLSQSPDGVLGLFALSLFVSTGFILFGQQRFEPGPPKPSSEDQHLA